ncbi:hypothetical protein QE152_g26409 [Popillia japonica]|uniref:Integrase catalytic domain-containing protein n=1 Tax=Popillia japonica TaxID=7064 RepID=A0AAW1JZN0_POPJA
MKKPPPIVSRILSYQNREENVFVVENLDTIKRIVVNLLPMDNKDMVKSIKVGHVVVPINEEAGATTEVLQKRHPVNQGKHKSTGTLSSHKCDNGKEYLNASIYKFTRKKGIRINPCPPYVHELNGVAERYNRSIMDMSRCLLAEVKVNQMYWPKVVKAAAYLKNHSLANTIERKTPYDIFFNEKPSVKYLRLYGSRVFSAKLGTSKWDNKAKLGVILGYSDVGYRILLNNRVIDARHVDIVEDDIRCIGFEDNEKVNDSKSEMNQNTINESTNSAQNGEIEMIPIQNSENDDSTNVRHSSRIVQPNSRYYNKDFVTDVNYCNAMVPNTFEEAIQIDADWAGDTVDRKSTSGYIIRLFGNTIYWKLSKQNSVTKSSTFAEYVALSEAVTDINFIYEMLKGTFNLKIERPIKIYEDNSGALIIAKNGNFSKNSKYIEVQYHFVSENCNKGNIGVIKIKYENNIADILTKALGKAKVIKFREMLKLKE